MAEDQGTLFDGEGQENPVARKRTKRSKEEILADARRRRQEKIAAKICTVAGCKTPAEQGKRRCETHRIRDNKILRAYRNKIGREQVNKWAREESLKRSQARRVRGQCWHCYAQAVVGRSCCQRCLTYKSDRYKAKLVAGKCECGQPKLQDQAKCQSCREKRQVLQRNMKQRRRDAGLCYKCGKGPPKQGRMTCAACLDQFADYAIVAKETRLAAGLCWMCGKEKHIDGTVAGICTGCYVKQTARAVCGSSRWAAALQVAFDGQGGICPYSGLKLTLGVDTEPDHRIPSSRGGSSDVSNIQWVHVMVNQMKYSYPEDDFLRMVEAIYRHRITPG